MFIFRLSFLPYQISFKFIKTLGCVDKFFLTVNQFILLFLAHLS